MDCSPPGPSVHGILQAGILGWVTSSRGSSPPGDGTRVSCVSCIGKGVLYHWDHGPLPRLAVWLFRYSPAGPLNATLFREGVFAEVTELKIRP